MAQPDIIDIFEDCVSRLNHGETIDDCLLLYPQYVPRLRPMLDAVVSVRMARISPTELIEDQKIVWQAIEQRMSDKVVNMPVRRLNIRYQLLVAVLMFLLLTLGTWFFLSRPNVDNTQDIIVPIAETPTPSPTFTPTLIPSPTLGNIATIAPESTVMLEIIASITLTPRPPETLTPTATVTNTLIPIRTESDNDLPVCKTPRTLADVVKQVTEIYPNTTIMNAKQLTQLGGRLVWEVKASHGFIITIDVACGYVLEIRPNNSPITPSIIYDEDSDQGSPSYANAEPDSENLALEDGANGDDDDDDGDEDEDDEDGDDDSDDDEDDDDE